MAEPPITDLPLAEIDRASSDPVALQTYRILRVALEVKPSGTLLPPEQQLIDRLGVSRVTLRKALRSLRNDGLVDASAVRGWFVP